MKRASSEPASRAAARLIEQHACDLVRDSDGNLFCTGCRATIRRMATTQEKLIEEAVSLLSPLAGTALEAVVDVVRLLVQHKDGAELAAKRSAQALAAEAFIRS